MAELMCYKHTWPSRFKAAVLYVNKQVNRKKKRVVSEDILGRITTYSHTEDKAFWDSYTITARI